MAEPVSTSIVPLTAQSQDQVRGQAQPRRRVFLRDLMLEAEIGAYESEYGRTQPICINLSMEVVEPIQPLSDDLSDVVCYNKISQGVADIIAEGHIKLVETLAERIAALCLSHAMVLSVTVCVEKPNAIDAARGAGVEIIRVKQPTIGRTT